MDKMTDMELDDEDIGETATPIPMPEAPRYPYGLRICLTHAELRKLKLDPAEASIGAYVHGHFMGCITSVSQNQTEHADECRVEVQIEQLAIESEDEENEEMEAQMTGTGRRRSPLYTRMARKEAENES